MSAVRPPVYGNVLDDEPAVLAVAWTTAPVSGGGSEFDFETRAEALEAARKIMVRGVWLPVNAAPPIPGARVRDDGKIWCPPSFVWDMVVTDAAGQNWRLFLGKFTDERSLSRPFAAPCPSHVRRMNGASRSDETAQ